ncbi:MAG: hypothetical protein ACE5GU_11810 [Candidatus Scalinduaceae bacterium]
MKQKNGAYFSSCLISLLSALLFSSCTTTTGTRVSHNQDTLSKINKIGITVIKNKKIEKIEKIGTATII